KDAGDIALEKLVKLYTKCLENRNVPRAWKIANIIFIHKKGDVKDLKNYRPISLLSVVYKLFTKIITTRIGTMLDSNQPREQAGFRSGYSTTDHMQVINQVMEKSSEFKKPLCMAFIDYEKAFDSVQISAVMEAIRKQGIEENYVQVLEDIYNDGTATIVLHKESEKIP
ncbi:RNA-directed DNA polymerase, partial [Klebsiella pneumoniae]|uniref:RNA-directed DNA polymerase n=1 Tax=Klebsiella pneumoniae TaxID=573 RepID=UPI003EBDD4F8